MFTYILIGCVVAALTDFIAFTMMGSRNISLMGAAFIITFWPFVIIYLVFFLIGELFEAIGRLTRKKNG